MIRHQDSMSSPCFNKKKGVAGIAFCGGPSLTKVLYFVLMKDGGRKRKEKGRKRKQRLSFRKRTGRGKEKRKGTILLWSGATF